jgi:hypothetical protein
MLPARRSGTAFSSLADGKGEGLNQFLGAKAGVDCGGGDGVVTY